MPALGWTSKCSCHGFSVDKWCFPIQVSSELVKRSSAHSRWSKRLLQRRGGESKWAESGHGTFAWETPWTEEPGGLQSMGSQTSWTQISNWTTATKPVSFIAWHTSNCVGMAKSQMVTAGLLIFELVRIRAKSGCSQFSVRDKGRDPAFETCNWRI